MNYQKGRSSTYLLNYHFVWIPRRRKAVLRGQIANRCRELIWEAAKEIDCQVISLAIEPDHVHLFINCPPTIAPYQVIHRIKGRTARFLRLEFPDPLMKLPSMWTSSYFVSTAGNVSNATIQKYIEAQGKSG
jgi:putative transposase